MIGFRKKPADSNAYVSKVSFLEKLRNLDKKQWAIIIVAAVVVIGGGVTAFLMFRNSPEPAKPQKITAKATPKPVVPTTVASTLSGLQVDPAVNLRPVTGVMVENSELARPQSGLDQADVIFEAIAEGGITRFLLLFQDSTPPYIGPIRSVRPYYIQWGMGFDAAIAHVGGSPEALANMREWKAKDLDQFANGNYYHRISSRYAPHNVYTSLATLNELENKKGFGKATYTSLVRKPDAPSKTPTATSIDLTISSSVFNAHYDYDATTNSYKRSQAGAAHTVADEAGNQRQLQPKVVVALVMSQGIASDDLHTAYGTIGSGHVYIFQDGVVSEGTWKKESNAAQLTFANAEGKTIGLNPGQTWFTAVSDTSRVSFKP